MPTKHQLAKLKIKGQKFRRNKVKALGGGPQARALLFRINIVSPRKPNSAKRRAAKVVSLKTKRKVFAHVPGLGEPGVNKNALVMIEGGGFKDVGGVNYSLMRGKLGFSEVESYGRANRRSKFGVKKPKKN